MIETSVTDKVFFWCFVNSTTHILHFSLKKRSCGQVAELCYVLRISRNTGHNLQTFIEPLRESKIRERHRTEVYHW